MKTHFEFESRKVKVSPVTIVESKSNSHKDTHTYTEKDLHRRIATIMYHVIAAFLWASSGIVVVVDVDATCSKFNDMFFFFLFSPHFI